ncbi:HIRAN domain-containing protein [uncultured Winogradskyella sp.]|uniref:HIRAN domain-containing protein n=1 Tax=uncultured Winogradskyella sp. TaxID=395353 RepID=UPI0026260AE3|nr:HIRAN domain-containing protein [uncultured Winogradskyella sp.]
MKKEYLANFCIAGFTYYEGVSVFRKLKIGKKLILKLEEENKYDPKAVAIYYKDSKIGFIPRNENRIFYKLIKIGLSNLIEIRVQQKDASAYPEEQIRLVAYLINKNSM